MAKRGSLKKFAIEEAKERPIRFRNYKYLFLIVCEDQRTEPEYFEKYVSQIPKETIYLEAIGIGRDPKGVVDKAIEERDALALRAKREVDVVWVVFDKDDADENATKIERFESAFNTAKEQKIEIAYSNEVFELWLLLHFMNVDKETPLPRNNIYQLLQEQFQRIPKYKNYIYDHSNPDSKTIEIIFESGNQDSAIKRAELLFEHHKNHNPIEANPSTKVYVLVKELLEWIRYFSYKPE